MSPVHTPPTYNETLFTCPHCDAHTPQIWCEGYIKLADDSFGLVNELEISKCEYCHENCVWYDGELIYPMDISYELPDSNPDLDPQILTIYQEAASVFDKSPRSSAALMRLCLELLLDQLEVKKGTLDSRIGRLVSDGISKRTQEALDTVRVYGSSAVHAGFIDLNDNTHIAYTLFAIINDIADQLLTQDRKRRELYDGIPQNKLDHIEKRDAKSRAAK